MQLIFNSIDIVKVEAEVYILPGSLLFQDGWVGGVEELRIKPSQLSTTGCPIIKFTFSI